MGHDALGAYLSAIDPYNVVDGIAASWFSVDADISRDVDPWLLRAGWSSRRSPSRPSGGSLAILLRPLPEGRCRMSTLELQGVSRWYGDVVAVNDVTMTIGPGVTGLLGPNGAGKSTLISMMGGFLAPSPARSRSTACRRGATPSVYKVDRPRARGRVDVRHGDRLGVRRRPTRGFTSFQTPRRPPGPRSSRST